MPAEIPLFSHALVTRDARGVYTLRIHNAKSINILSSNVSQSLTDAAHWLARQPDARAVIVRGTGEKAFVGGANIHEMATLNPESARGFITTLRHLCDAVRALPIPTIARIPGFCLGGGLELAAACDIRLGSDLSRFGMPEVRIGIPSVIHAALLPSLIGVGATNWLLLTGETVDAAQALQWGFLQFACDAASLDELLEKTVAAVVANGPLAVRSQKSLLRYWEESTVADGIDHSVVEFGEAFATSEPVQYMAPFLERGRSDR